MKEHPSDRHRKDRFRRQLDRVFALYKSTSLLSEFPHVVIPCLLVFRAISYSQATSTVNKIGNKISPS